MRRRLYPSDRFPDGHRDLARSLHTVGDTLSALGRQEESLERHRVGRHQPALEHFREGLEMSRRLYPAERFPGGSKAVAASLNNVGSALRSLGRHDEALEHHRRALAMWRRLYPEDRFPRGHQNL